MSDSKEPKKAPMAPAPMPVEKKRLTWRINSTCLIYSRSDNEWYEAKIVAIKRVDSEQKDGEPINEWLTVKYKDGKKTKKIQRFCRDIKPIPNDHNSRLKKGSRCLIYSNVLQLWCKGQVIKIETDTEGEWLTIKYWDTTEHKICEIQRYSKDLKLFSQRLLYRSIITIPEPPKPWIKIKSNNEILPVKVSNVVKLNKNEFIVSGYSHDNEYASDADENGIYKFNIKQGQWQIWIPYPKEFFSQYHNMCVDYANQIIYFIVGFGGIGMWKCDIKTHQFESLALPQEDLYGALSYVIDGQLNIFWGNGSNQHLVWTGKTGYVVEEFTHLRKGLISYGMVYNKKDNSFLLLGGFKGKDVKNPRTDHIWKFRVDDREWEKLKIKLPDKMQSFGCVISLDCKYILILGGSDDDGLNDKIYILDLNNMKWKMSKVISPFRGIGYGNFIMVEKDGIEYVYLINGMYSSMGVPLETIVGE